MNPVTAFPFGGTTSSRRKVSRDVNLIRFMSFAVTTNTIIYQIAIRMIIHSNSSALDRRTRYHYSNSTNHAAVVPVLSDSSTITPTIVANYLISYSTSTIDLPRKKLVLEAPLACSHGASNVFLLNQSGFSQLRN